NWADGVGVPQPPADARVEVVEGEILDLGRDGTGVEEGDAAEPAVDRKAPLDVEDELAVPAQRVAGGIQRADLVQLVPAHGRAAAGLEPVLDHERVGDAVGCGQPETTRQRQHGRRCHGKKKESSRRNLTKSTVPPSAVVPNSNEV